MTISVNSLAERAFRRPMADNVRKRLEQDIDIIFSRMLNRSDWVREFLLSSSPSADVLLLMAPFSSSSSFILETNEHQEGRLTGSIRLRYLIVPSFSTPDGLSGGAVVTSYAKRNHPLHRPHVMATTRTGRFIRDNASGEWLIITRNESDNVTRVQWLHSSKATTRERICLTCNTELFNKGMYVESILFECHDEEWRPCPHCHAPPESNCECSKCHSALVVPKHPLDLQAVAAAALGEPKSEWFGRVQVSVLSNLSRDLQGDVDACMQLRTSFEASQDATLAQMMQNLALAERAKRVIPMHVLPPKLISNDATACQPLDQRSSTFNGLDHAPTHVGAELIQPPLSDTHSNAPLDLGMVAAKSLPLDAVAPQILEIDDTKTFPHDDDGHVPGIVLGIGSGTSRDPPPHNPHPATAAFDPMALLMTKQTQVNGVAHNSEVPREQSNGSHRIPNGDKKQASVDLHHHHIPQHPLASANHLGLEGLESLEHPSFSSNFNNVQRADQNSTSSSSHSSLEEGVVPSSHTAGKSFDSFLSTFMNPSPPSSTVTDAGISAIDLTHQEGWLDSGIHPNAAPIQNSKRRKRKAQPNGNSNGKKIDRQSAAVQAHNVPTVLDMYSASVNAVENSGHGTAVHSSAAGDVQKAHAPVTPVTVIVKNPTDDGIRLANGAVYPNGNMNPQHRPGIPVTRGLENGVHGEEDEDAVTAASLVRLEPRPPGMAAHADGHWMWQMGQRGAMGMATIAAARERERRAEERRRKNREAAARSNARAKERITSIKGELERNKTKITKLAKKRRELQTLNETLKRRLTENVVVET